MVIRLPTPTTDDSSYIDALIAQNEPGPIADRFQKMRNDWKKRVESYIANGGDPEVLKPWPDVMDCREIFENLYRSRPLVNSAQKPVLDSLRDKSLLLCPACGEDGTPNTLDHYLPKSIYPEFSVTSRNLFPMCDVCQGKKLTKTVNKDAQRQFVHPYFDYFAEQQVLRMIIGRPFESPSTISLCPHPTLGPEQSALIKRHIDALEIPTRYNHFFKGEYMRLRRMVGRVRTEKQVVRNRIIEFQQYARDKAINSWGHIFYEGVLDDLELMNYLETGPISPHL